MTPLRRKQEGQAMVEFALILPLLLVIVLGIIHFGVVLNNYVTLTDAVRAGARQAAVSRTVANPTQATTDRVKQSAAGLDQSQLEITVTPYNPNDGTNTWVQGGDVTVEAKYPFSVRLLGWVVMSGHLKSTTTERVE
jgi:Flp pilus assembly protein TadG